MAWHSLVKKNATVYDTIGLIIDFARKYPNQRTVTEAIRVNDTPRDYEFLQNLFRWVCANVIYLQDKYGKELVYTPDRLMREGKGDCKKMSTFIGAVLNRKGINHYYKVISYDEIGYEHIYVIVPKKGGGYITMDTVNNCQFNKEIPHKKAMVYDINGKRVELHAMGKAPGNNYNSYPLFYGGWDAPTSPGNPYSNPYTIYGMGHCPPFVGPNSFANTAWRNSYFGGRIASTYFPGYAAEGSVRPGAMGHGMGATECGTFTTEDSCNSASDETGPINCNWYGSAYDPPCDAYGIIKTPTEQRLAPAYIPPPSRRPPARAALRPGTRYGGPFYREPAPIPPRRPPFPIPQAALSPDTSNGAPSFRTPFRTPQIRPRKRRFMRGVTQTNDSLNDDLEQLRGWFKMGKRDLTRLGAAGTYLFLPLFIRPYNFFAKDQGRPVFNIPPDLNSKIDQALSWIRESTRDNYKPVFYDFLGAGFEETTGQTPLNAIYAMWKDKNFALPQPNEPDYPKETQENDGTPTFDFGVWQAVDEAEEPLKGNATTSRIGQAAAEGETGGEAGNDGGGFNWLMVLKWSIIGVKAIYDGFRTNVSKEIENYPAGARFSVDDWKRLLGGKIVIPPGAPPLADQPPVYPPLPQPGATHTGQTSPIASISQAFPMSSSIVIKTKRQIPITPGERFTIRGLPGYDGIYTATKIASDVTTRATQIFTNGLMNRDSPGWRVVETATGPIQIDELNKGEVVDGVSTLSPSGEAAAGTALIPIGIIAALLLS